MADEEVLDYKSSEVGEILKPRELVISEEVYANLQELTRQKSLAGGEFSAYLLGKNGVTGKVVVTNSTSYSTAPQTAVNFIKLVAPLLDEGYLVAGEFHNHPQDNIDVYENSGLPSAFALCPSGGDLIGYGLRDADSRAIKDLIGYWDFPHMIGAYFPHFNRALFNAFNFLKCPSEEEQRLIDQTSVVRSVESPVVFPGTKPKPYITGFSYIDPRQLVGMKVIDLIALKVQKQHGNVDDVPNALGSALRSI